MPKTVRDLTLAEAINLALCGFIEINGEKLYKKTKHCYLADALNACGENEIIVKNTSMHYVLSKTIIYENRKQNHLFGPCEKLRY